jgi:LPXTG-motif cell wall-anchored protein
MGVRRIAAVAVIAAMAALGLGTVTAATAGAATIDYCSYTVDPPVITGGGGTVTVAGTAPQGSPVFAFIDGVLQQPAPITTADAVTGAFSFPLTIGATSRIAVTVDSYPATECAVDEEAQQALLDAAVARARAARLSYTGASNTGTLVMLGFVMVALGAILVVLVRRRETVRGRNGG